MVLNVVVLEAYGPHNGVKRRVLLTHVVIVVKLCCVEGLMGDRYISNKHSR